MVLAEGLAEHLPTSVIDGIARDDHGHLSLGKVNLSDLIATMVGERYKLKTGDNKKTRGVQLGYEARCSQPHAFDVMLGSQLGIGAYRALTQKPRCTYGINCGSVIIDLCSV